MQLQNTAVHVMEPLGMQWRTACGQMELCATTRLIYWLTWYPEQIVQNRDRLSKFLSVSSYDLPFDT